MTTSNAPETKAAAEGIRGRKRRQTRERIAGAAMTLFLKRGFEATTVDDIAAAADVSKRSFFDYFPTKEDVVFAWQDEFSAALAEAVGARPADESLAVVAEKALTSSIVAAAHPQAIAIARLNRDTPALRARDQLKYAKLEQTLAEALAERVDNERDRFRARLLAVIVIGALRVGSDAWLAQGRTDPAQAHIFTEQVFQTVWAELREFGRTAMREKPKRSK